MNKNPRFFNFLINGIGAKKNSSGISLRMTQLDCKSPFAIFGICYIDLMLCFFFFSPSFFLLPECHQVQRKMPLAVPHSFRQRLILSAELVIVLNLD